MQIGPVKIEHTNRQKEMEDAQGYLHFYRFHCRYNKAFRSYIYIYNAAIARQTAEPNWLTMGAIRLDSHIG